MKQHAAVIVVAVSMLGSGIFGPMVPPSLSQTTDAQVANRAALFAKLRGALAVQPDVQVVGERFVIQSDLLFQPGAATLQPAGEKLLITVARLLMETSSGFPGNMRWGLQVEGHTDITPISNSIFPSNWELSTARALSVVKFLHGAGVPNDRLAAAGFSQYQPLSSIDRARNRRIELKLVER